MRILVTGGAGFIGSAVVRHCLRHTAHDVVNLDKLIYAARTRNGFTPASRAALFRKLKSLEIPECPFANLPEKKDGRWGAGLTAAKMAKCRWLKPQLVGQFEFVEWTEDAHLRHSRFMALCGDKKPKDVKRE